MDSGTSDDYIDLYMQVKDNNIYITMDENEKNNIIRVSYIIFIY